MNHSKLLLLSTLLLAAALTPSSIKSQTPPPVYVVLFTHIEDNCPPEPLRSPQSLQNYFFWRSKTIAIADLFLKHQVKWVFEPDWTFLEAALAYEVDSVTATTNHKNLLRYLKEDLQVSIDPHSHEHRGYNYTDVAHLLDSLGVGGSTVVGGHVWDPGLPQFQNWDRFRVPVSGSKYPWALWRGDILMGSATPNHTNDPQVSGVWRPKDRYHFFEDDPTGNIVNVGQYKESGPGNYENFIQHTNELIGLYTSGIVPQQYMLTISMHLSPTAINAPHGLQIIEDSLLVPLVDLQRQGKVKITDFTSLVEDWKTIFGAQAFIYDPNGSVGVTDHDDSGPEKFMLFQNYPNPFNSTTKIHFALAERQHVSLRLFDARGRELAMLMDGLQDAGKHQLTFNSTYLPSGIYFFQLTTGSFSQLRKALLIK